MTSQVAYRAAQGTAAQHAQHETNLLHHDSVVTLKGDINIHVGLHRADLVGSQETLPSTALPALLQDVHPAPGGGCLQPTGQHMDGLPILGIPLCC